METNMPKVRRALVEEFARREAFRRIHTAVDSRRRQLVMKAFREDDGETKIKILRTEIQEKLNKDLEGLHHQYFED